MECSALNPARRNWFVCFALIALVFAQTAAMLHQMGHAASGPDTPALPGQHAGLCTDCVSHAPLLAMAGGAGALLLLALQVAAHLRPILYRAPIVRAVQRAFRSRAPPR